MFVTLLAYSPWVYVSANFYAPDERQRTVTSHELAFKCKIVGVKNIASSSGCAITSRAREACGSDLGMTQHHPLLP